MCDYAEGGSGAAPTSEDFAALQAKLIELEGRLSSRSEDQPSSTTLSDSDAYLGRSDLDSGDHANIPTWTNRFPSVLFLDTDVYKFASTIPPQPEVDIPLVSRMVWSKEKTRRVLFYLTPFRIGSDIEMPKWMLSLLHHLRMDAAVPRYVGERGGFLATFKSGLSVLETPGIRVPSFALRRSTLLFVNVQIYASFPLL